MEGWGVACPSHPGDCCPAPTSMAQHSCPCLQAHSPGAPRPRNSGLPTAWMANSPQGVTHTDQATGRPCPPTALQPPPPSMPVPAPEAPGPLPALCPCCLPLPGAASDVPPPGSPPAPSQHAKPAQVLGTERVSLRRRQDSQPEPGLLGRKRLISVPPAVRTRRQPSCSPGADTAPGPRAASWPRGKQSPHVLPSGTELCRLRRAAGVPGPSSGPSEPRGLVPARPPRAQPLFSVQD